MRLPNIIIPFIVIAILSGCINTSEQNVSASDLSDAEKDTLIYSSPSNYSLVMDESDSSSKVEIRDYKDMFALFEKLNYTPEAWQAGIREVPRVYLPIIGEKWGPTTSKEITVENKKRLFFRGLAPLILRSNELIMMDRNRLGEIKTTLFKEMTVNIFRIEKEKWKRLR